jgi:hypothetical protein
MTATTTDAYDGPLSALRNHVDDLGAWLGIWVNRREPDARARRCASDAVNAIDAMLRELYLVRGRLVSETRASDDATATRDPGDFSLLFIVLSSMCPLSHPWRGLRTAGRR